MEWNVRKIDWFFWRRFSKIWIQFQFRKKDTFFCCSRFFVAVDFLWQGSDQKQKKSRNHFSTAKKNRRFHSSGTFKKSTDFSAVEFEFSFNFKKRPIFLWQSIFCCSRFFVVEIWLKTENLLKSVFDGCLCRRFFVAVEFLWHRKTPVGFRWFEI